MAAEIRAMLRFMLVVTPIFYWGFPMLHSSILRMGYPNFFAAFLAFLPFVILGYLFQRYSKRKIESSE